MYCIRVVYTCKHKQAPCNENQLDALFILRLFRQSTSVCFGHVCSPSSGGMLYIYNKWYVLCFLVDCLLVWPPDSQLKNRKHANCCMYTAYLLMMGYTYARNTEWCTKNRPAISQTNVGVGLGLCTGN